MSPAQELLRGVRRGSAVVITGDTRRLRELRAQVERSDYVAEAWREVGAEMRKASETVSKASSSK